MAEAQNNKPVLHRKEWQTMMPAITASAANTFVVNDNANLERFAFYVVSATVHYLYDHSNDDWIQVASGAFSPAIAAGACGCFSDWSPTFTATGGSTTTITVALNTHNINGFVVGKYVEFLSGTAANLGLRREITGISTSGIAGSTITLTISAADGAVANNDTFRINSGSFFIFTSGTLATSFKRFDIATLSWGSSLSISSIGATWGTDARMVYTGMYGVSYDTGTATSGSSTTLVDSGKTWGTDQWINYQVRITGGTGVGQIRTITDSNSTTLTFAAGATIDATSTYVIEGDENAIYLMGNNATATYKYSISGNSWSTISPTAARGGAAVAGMTAEFIGVTGDTTWASKTNIQDGRYIYSFRGTTAVLDRLSLNGGTSGAYTWETVTYHPSLQVLATGSGSDWDAGTGYIYFNAAPSTTVPVRIYRYSVVKNEAEAVTSDWYLGGAAVQGNKMWIRALSSANLVKWIYYLGHTSTLLRRIMLY
jgi:hypothetical protein